MKSREEALLRGLGGRFRSPELRRAAATLKALREAL
jgi:hypothetical protein